MIDLISFNKSLKTSWMQKYLDSTNNGKWKVFFDLALQNYGRENVFTGILNIKDTITSIKVSDAFLVELLKLWAEVNFEQKITTLEQLQEQSLWHNSLIRIESKPIFFKDWCSEGITKVKHLQIPESNNSLSLIEFQQKYDLNVPPSSANELTLMLNIVASRILVYLVSLKKLALSDLRYDLRSFTITFFSCALASIYFLFYLSIYFFICVLLVTPVSFFV